MKVLLGVTGSIASTLTLKLQSALEQAGHEIDTIVTESALKIGRKLDGEDPDWRHYWTDRDEWDVYESSNTVLHIDLVKWADIFLIAPCTGNTMNKLRAGISDNLLTCCALAWNFSKPMLIAPAMNTQMWENTKEREWIINYPDAKLEFIQPQEKTLYCGDTGLGAMAEISDIVAAVNRYNLVTPKDCFLCDNPIEGHDEEYCQHEQRWREESYQLHNS